MGTNTVTMIRPVTDKAGYLPVGPLRSWLAEYTERVGGEQQAALELGKESRIIYRVLHESHWVTLQLADELFIAAGEPHTFVLLYPINENGRMQVGPLRPVQPPRVRRPAGALTPTEALVLKAFAAGNTAAQIADDLAVLPCTIQAHTKAIRKKLGVHKTADAVAEAVLRGLLGDGQNRGVQCA